MGHTKEPWQVAKMSGQDMWAVGPSATRRAGDVYTEANARRIVACVNACEAFSTQQLEEGQVIGIIGELRLQRDALLAALKDAVEHIKAVSGKDLSCDPSEDVSEYEAAIAKVQS